MRTHLRRLLLPLALGAALWAISPDGGVGGNARAAEWSWTWPARVADEEPTAEVCRLKYGKRWAYAIEIDDGPKWIASFATAFLAQDRFTDAPPGEPGGRPRPFVGSAAVIAAATGNNDALLHWQDVDALLTTGWGVMNHSLRLPDLAL